MHAQVHKFLVGVAPVRSLCRVGWAAKQLLSIPADQLRNTTVSNGNGSSDVTLTRQLRRGVTSLARAVTLEALGLGASVAGGADFVLRGGSGQGSEHPAGRGYNLLTCPSQGLIMTVNHLLCLSNGI